MSDFLTRLAERSLGIASVARPELAPMFTSDVAAPREVARQLMMPARQAEPQHTVDDSRPPALSREMPRPMESTERAATTAQRAAFTRIEARTSSQTEDYEPIVSNAQVLSAPEVMFPPDESVRPARQTDLDLSARPAPPSLSPFRSNGRELPHTNAAPATVNITIGRVEVRAIKESSKPRPETPRSQGLSLDQYLRERNQKRR